MSAPSVMALVRPDLQAFAGYSSARSSALVGDVWLNANESAWANPADSEGRARRYPDPQPAALRARLAQLYGCAPEQLLIGRGSDEAIDLLVRALCEPGRDAVLVTPPVFGMYAVCARLQNAPLLEVPLRDDGDALNADIDAVIATALAGNARLVFLCSPSNPAGSAVTLNRSNGWQRHCRAGRWWWWTRPMPSTPRCRRRSRCWPRTTTWPSCGRCPRRTHWRPRGLAA